MEDVALWMLGIAFILGALALITGIGNLIGTVPEYAIAAVMLVGVLAVAVDVVS